MNMTLYQAFIPLGMVRFIILLEGLITISVELLVIRQLMPVAGNSLIVTSTVIGVFLLFLAIGYLKGGYIKAHYLQQLIFNFSFTLLWIGAGLSTLVIHYYFYYMQKLWSLWGTLALYLLILVAPIVYWLGQTLPILTNYFNKDRSIAAISGQALYWSTLGSCLGAIMTLALLNWLGVAWMVMLNCGLLALLIAIIFHYTAVNYKLALLLIMALVGIGMMNVSHERATYVRTNHYANYAVVPLQVLPAQRIGRALFINRSFGSFLDMACKGTDYIEKIKQLLFNELKLQHRDILVLGAGGFTLSAEYTFGNSFTYVDIDPMLPFIAEQDFLKQAIQGEFIAADARVFVQQTSKKFDVIISDAYSHTIAIPSHLLTFEYFQAIYRMLKNPGWAVFNIIAHPQLNDAYAKRIDNTISAVFSSCMKIPLSLAAEQSNIIYLCYKNQYNEDKQIYTDDLHHIAIDSAF